MDPVCTDGRKRTRCWGHHLLLRAKTKQTQKHTSRGQSLNDRNERTTALSDTHQGESHGSGTARVQQRSQLPSHTDKNNGIGLSGVASKSTARVFQADNEDAQCCFLCVIISDTSYPNRKEGETKMWQKTRVGTSTLFGICNLNVTLSSPSNVTIVSPWLQRDCSSSEKENGN